MERPQGTRSDIALVFDSLHEKLEKRLQQKGFGVYVSTHEEYGIISEEVYEALKALHKNDNDNFKEELEDIAIACIWSLVSHRKREGK